MPFAVFEVKVSSSAALAEYVDQAGTDRCAENCIPTMTSRGPVCNRSDRAPATNMSRQPGGFGFRAISFWTACRRRC
jgi:hypothetical protein